MFRICYKPSARKCLDDIPQQFRGRIIMAIENIGENPYCGKKLSGKLKGLYSFRAWPYRIIYQIYREMITVVIVDIGHRQSIYG